jgi:hypothetical protein
LVKERHKHEKQQKFAIKAKEAFETLKDRLAKAESTQKASMVVESQNKCLADELNEYIEQILEGEASIVVEQTAALHAEELARVRLESEASASHAVEKKLQEMSTLHSAELTKLREELHFMSSERVQAEALHAAEREALERERGEAGTKIARAREAHANIYQTIKHSLVIIKHKLLIQAAASSEGACDRNSEWCDAAEAELASACTQVEEAKSRNESLEAENDAARKGLMRRIAELERFRADLTSLLRAEERDNDSNRAIAAALRSDASSHAATVARLEGSVEELNDSIAQMITQFKVQFSTLTEEKDQLARNYCSFPTYLIFTRIITCMNSLQKIPESQFTSIHNFASIVGINRFLAE